MSYNKETNCLQYNKKIEYLKSNKFKTHYQGNSGLYGLNFLGSPSIIQHKDDLYIFIYWLTGSNIANYINIKGEMFSFNPYNKDLDTEISRMEEDTDTN
jgi:hypothetical protein